MVDHDRRKYMLQYDRKTTWRGGEEDLDDWIAMQKHEGSMATVKRTTLQPDMSVTQPSRSIPSSLLPRTFLFHWNNSKARSKRANPGKEVMRECYGCRFPNGRVCLDYGLGFESMTDLTDHVACYGEYSVQYLDGGE